MNYIYDLLLNFNENIYEFYDWNKTDNIKHIKKIPIFKIDSKKMKQLKTNKIIFEEAFLEKIYNKTEEFTSRKNRHIDYACLFTDSTEVIGINIGKKTTYSKLLLDEEFEVTNMSLHMKEVDIPFKIIGSKEKEEFKTRKELEQISTAKKVLKNILNENNPEKLKYLYYECFDKKNDSIEEIIKELNKKIENKNIINKINDFVNIKNV